jgi:hypothetical protein
MTIFTVQERDRVRDRVLELAASDARITAGAIVGSLAHDAGDRWSDLDLTFGVAEDIPVQTVLDDWTGKISAQCDAVHLFDVPSGPTIYRVFLLPGCLQFDLSFTPASQFGALGPKFKLLFGKAMEKPFAQDPSMQELFGYAVHHALRARFCIERGRHWQAEYWISATRDYALSLACRRREIPASYGRGFDDLPSDVHDAFRGAFATSLERNELLRALGEVIEALLCAADPAQSLAALVEPQLRQLMCPWDG